MHPTKQRALLDGFIVLVHQGFFQKDLHEVVYLSSDFVTTITVRTLKNDNYEYFKYYKVYVVGTYLDKQTSDYFQFG